jgi:hypothetical protein
MTSYALTLFSTGNGWTDVRVLNAGDMHEAISIAEHATGCRVSHGRGGEESAFDPSLTIDAATGERTQHHARAARPEVIVGPPDVMRAIAQVLRPPRS